MNFWMSLLYVVIGAVIGAFAGWYFTRKAFEKQLENPPINERMIRAMFMQMGRKPPKLKLEQCRSMNQINSIKKQVYWVYLIKILS